MSNIDYTHLALQIAIQDFNKFCKMSGVNMNQLKVCIERERGLSLQQIANKLKIGKDTVYAMTNRCFKTDS